MAAASAVARDNRLLPVLKRRAFVAPVPHHPGTPSSARLSEAVRPRNRLIVAEA